jgi:hypothetical protein
VLLFVNKHADGADYTTTDFGLGFFGFAYDDLGRQVVVRAEGEIFGWDLTTNQPHQEPRRLAEAFLDYIRAVASGRPGAPAGRFGGYRFRAPHRHLREAGGSRLHRRRAALCAGEGH